MKECRKIKRSLSRYLDKETGNAETVLVEAHLDSCSLCKKELLGLTRVKELVLERERKSLSQDYLIFRLREEIADEQRVAKQGFLWLSCMGNLSRRLIPVPVTIIVLSIAFLILNSQQQASNSTLEDNILKGVSVTTENTLGLILGEVN